MAKTIYRREKLEPELGYVGAHNFLMQQAKRGIDSPFRTSRAVRVWVQHDDKKILEEVIVAS